MNINNGVSSDSGFIISSDGIIVNNVNVVAHRLGSNDILTIALSNSKRLLIDGTDAKSDIALVKIDEFFGEELHTVSFGYSSKVQAGELLIAIGSPMMLQNSASFGIVSATTRQANELGISSNRSEYIQTDAGVHLGNSNSDVE